MCPRLLLEVILTWWALVGSGWLGLGCLVLRADTRENPEGRNEVMTLGIGLDRRCWWRGWFDWSNKKVRDLGGLGLRQSWGKMEYTSKKCNPFYTQSVSIYGQHKYIYALTNIFRWPKHLKWGKMFLGSLFTSKQTDLSEMIFITLCEGKSKDLDLDL